MLMMMNSPMFGKQGAGALPATIRATSKQYVNNSDSCVYPFPVGTTAGDIVIIFTSHGYGTGIPSGWEMIGFKSGVNYQGSVLYKAVTSGDVTTGSVTITFGTIYYGHVMGVALVGHAYPLRTIVDGQHSSGAASRTISTDASPQAGDLALYYGAARVNATVTASSGTILQTDSQANSSAVLASEVIGSSGAVSETYNYSGFPSGDYQAIVVICGAAPPAPSTATQWRLYITATQGAGNFPAIVELQLRGTVGGVDQTLVGTYTASSSFGGSWSADKAFDGSFGTYWLANSAITAWLGFESPTIIDVAQIAITAGGNNLNQAPIAFNLQYFNGSTWTMHQSWTTPATWTVGETRLFNV